MNSVNREHPMTQLLQENATKFIACIIWKLRRHCPNLAIEITTQDMEQLANVFMAHGQRGIVACIGKHDRVVLQLLDQVSGKALAADAKLDENSPNARGMQRAIAARKRAAAIANRLRHDADVAAVGKPLAYDAAEVLDLLVWEPTE